MDGGKKQRSKSGFSVSFPSSVEHIEAIVSEAVNHIKTHSINIDIFAFKLALYEGLSNAVRHGNNSNPAKDVLFELKLAGNSLTMQIKDCGKGFDWQEATNRELLDCKTPSGRGIMLLKAYGYPPKYNQKGNILILEKNLN